MLGRLSANLVRSQQQQTQQDDKAAAGEQKQPISVAAKLSFDEKQLTTATAVATAGTRLAIRYYEEAEAVIKVNETGRTPKRSIAAPTGICDAANAK